MNLWQFIALTDRNNRISRQASSNTRSLLSFSVGVAEAIQGFFDRHPLSSITAHQEMLGIPLSWPFSWSRSTASCITSTSASGTGVGRVDHPGHPSDRRMGRGKFCRGPGAHPRYHRPGTSDGTDLPLLGISGLGKKITAMVPNSLRIGIILGAGISSVISVAGTRMQASRSPCSAAWPSPLSPCSRSTSSAACTRTSV